MSVKEAVLPFNRFPDVDTVLGPEMRATGEVMGIDQSFGLAFAKSQMAAGNRLPDRGTVLFSLADGLALRMLSEPDYDYGPTIEAGVTAVRQLIRPV